MTWTVLIVDDPRGVPDLRASDAGGGTDAVAVADRLGPGVVLLDIRLPDLDGFAVAERLAELVQPPWVVLVSSRDPAVWAHRLRQSPARGFLGKSQLTGAAKRRLLW